MYKNQGTYGGAQPQLGSQQGNYVNPHYLGREEEIVQQMNPQKWYHPGNEIGESIARPQSHFGWQNSGYTTGQHGGFTGQQTGFRAGAQPSFQTGHQPGSQTGLGMQTGFQTGMQTGMQTGFQTGAQTGQTGIQTGQQAARFGATELMMVHEILTDTIDGINQFELYRQHVKDQQLMQILDNQVNHMFNGYNKLVNYLHNQGAGSIVPYRTARSASVKYGLRQPSTVQPNTSINEMDDRDVASGMMGCHKATACLRLRGTLECADPTLRGMLSNCAISSVNMAYEVFLWMNQKGMYQVPTLAQQTTQTMMGVYQNVNQPSFRQG